MAIATDEKPKAAETAAAAKSDEAAGKDAPKEEEVAKPGKKISPLTIIIAAVVSFVIFLGVFSYMMGVFDPAPPPSAETQDGDATGVADSLANGDYVSAYGKAAAAVEAAQEANAIDTVAELAQLDKRKRELDAKEQDIAKQKQELEQLRAQIETLMDKKEAVAEEKLAYVAKLLDGMKPDEMSGLISNLDNPTIMAVLPRMKPQTASRVLATLPPERAAKITMELIDQQEPAKNP